jgi:hypothetical protein
LTCGLCFAGAARDERDGGAGVGAVRRRAAARAHHPEPRGVGRAPAEHVVEHVDVVLLPERVPRPRAAGGVRRGQRHQAARGAAAAAVRGHRARRLLPSQQTLPLHVNETPFHLYIYRRERLPDHLCFSGPLPTIIANQKILSK